MEKESYEKLPSYPPSSSMEMETLMKRPEVTLKDRENAEKWKTKVISMLETKFTSIILKSSTDVGHTNLHTVDLQVCDGNPVFIKQYTIPLNQGFIDEETKLHDPGSHNCAVFMSYTCINFTANLNSTELHLQGVAPRSQYR